MQLQGADVTLQTGKYVELPLMSFCAMTHSVPLKAVSRPVPADVLVGVG